MNAVEGTSRIREVWAENLAEEMAYIRAAIDEYPFVAMVRPLPSYSTLPLTAELQDTEFPGVVARPIGSFRGSSDYHYQTLRCNVDLLRIIQLGLTLADEKGELAPGVCTWQFNFRFNIKSATLLHVPTPLHHATLHLRNSLPLHLGCRTIN